MRLFHFSDDNSIDVFMPRVVQGLQGIDAPQVWAIDDWHQAMYLFPHDCPRIFVWPVETTTPEYLTAYQKMTSSRMVAHIELGWLERLSRIIVYRYEFSPEAFEPLGNSGMWMSSRPTMPVNVERIDNIEKALTDAGVELRVLPSLKTLEPLWETSLHVSGIGLAHAKDGPIGQPRLVN